MLFSNKQLMTVCTVMSMPLKGDMKMPTVNDVPESLKTYPHFVTGSVRFGRAHKDSDLDIAVPLWVASYILDGKIKTPCKNTLVTSGYNNGFKYFDGVTVNIIPLSFVDFCAWSRATKMLEAVKITEKLSKSQHCAIFEALRGLCKMTLPDDINDYNFEKYL